MRGRVITVSVVAVFLAVDLFFLTRTNRGRELSTGPAPTSTAVPTSTTLVPALVEATTTLVDPATTTSAPKLTTATTRRPATTRPVTGTAPKPVAAVTPPPPAVALPAAFSGLGTWVDVFDFNPAHSNGAPPVSPAAVDSMAAAGVRTLYIQAARPEDPAAPDDLVSPGLLAEFLTRAHSRGMRVVAWYLPHFASIDDDMRHLNAMLAFTAGAERFDAVGLDIEWRNSVPDTALRNERLVELSRRLRAASPDRPVGAVVLPPVVTDIINPAYWPGFPWATLRPLFDVWLPMAYWTNRTAGTADRDAYRYVTDNVRFLRGHLGDVPIHVIGGIGNAATAADYEGFARALSEQAVNGRSVYDWATSGPSPLGPLRT